MKHARFLVGAALALTSVWALAQEEPESLLPPGMDNPAPRPSAAPPPRAQEPASGAQAAGADSRPQAPGTAAPAAGTGAVLDGGSTFSGASGFVPPANLPSLEQLEQLSPDELDELLGLKPRFDIPAAARRSTEFSGIIDETEGGLPRGALAGQNASLVRAALAGNKGRLVSRWGHILLRRALASRLAAPAGMNPADFAALRAALLVRMGEGEVARSLVQDIDSGNYTPQLTQAALDAYIATADFTGICPAVTIQGGARDDAQWKAVQAVCLAFRGQGNQAMTQLDRALYRGDMPKIDLLLAQKYAGAAGKSQRAVKIEWDGVNNMTPWRYALTISVGLQPPAALMADAGWRYDAITATAPMLGLATRAAAADHAAGAGVLSSAAMVDLYSQLHADPESEGDLAARASLLRDAYVSQAPRARLAAMRQLWDGATDPLQRHSREVLTAYAAARIPASSEFSTEAPGLIASMLTAGLDANALRWTSYLDKGSQGWALLVLAAPSLASPVDASALDTFHDKDQSEDDRKSALLLAGLAGLGRISTDTADDFAQELGLDMRRQSRWTQAIEQSASANNRALVALLAGLGMQGENWSKMTPLYLYHIVSTLRQVGMAGEARMIAAEAVARG